MQKIKSISEAFSMQPIHLSICRTQHEHHKTCIKEIVPETRKVDSDKRLNYYAGYNFKNQIIFEYLQSSVNVHYESQ